MAMSGKAGIAINAIAQTPNVHREFMRVLDHQNWTGDDSMAGVAHHRPVWFNPRINEGIMPKKTPAFAIPYLKPRAVTDALRKQVREELPEIAQIKNTALREKIAEAWAF